jgi:hypothetical protein
MDTVVNEAGGGGRACGAVGRATRGTAWTGDEDIVILEANMHCTYDAVVGANQKVDDFVRAVRESAFNGKVQIIESMELTGNVGEHGVYRAALYLFSGNPVNRSDIYKIAEEASDVDVGPKFKFESAYLHARTNSNLIRIFTSSPTTLAEVSRPVKLSTALFELTKKLIVYHDAPPAGFGNVLADSVKPWIVSSTIRPARTRSVIAARARRRPVIIRWLPARAFLVVRP